MSLTKGDLKKISELFNDGFELFVLPHFDRIYRWQERMEYKQEKVEIWQGRMGKQLRSINKRIGGYVVDANNKFEENQTTIGHYFEKCATKEAHKELEERVQKLELSRT